MQEITLEVMQNQILEDQAQTKLLLMQELLKQETLQIANKKRA